MFKKNTHCIENTHSNLEIVWRYETYLENVTESKLQCPEVGRHEEASNMSTETYKLVYHFVIFKHVLHCSLTWFPVCCCNLDSVDPLLVFVLWSFFSIEFFSSMCLLFQSVGDYCIASLVQSFHRNDFHVIWIFPFNYVDSFPTSICRIRRLLFLCSYPNNCLVAKLSLPIP